MCQHIKSYIITFVLSQLFQMDFKKIKKTFFANCTWGFVSEFRPSQFTTINDLTQLPMAMVFEWKAI